MEEYMAKNARLADWEKRVSRFFTLEEQVFKKVINCLKIPPLIHKVINDNLMLVE